MSMKDLIGLNVQYRFCDGGSMYKGIIIDVCFTQDRDVIYIIDEQNGQVKTINLSVGGIFFNEAGKAELMKKITAPKPKEKDVTRAELMDLDDD